MENNISFKCFNVHRKDNKVSFIHFNISDTEEFYKSLFEYFFDETTILKYIENKKSVLFEKTKKNFVMLYKHLHNYIDIENYLSYEFDKNSFSEKILGILNEEYKLNEKNGKFKVRLDKMGKFGEFMFCNLLAEYFKFDCIIPKVNLTTDNNMSVFGIDTLYYSKDRKMILFGESKVSKNLNNGIDLLKESLNTYKTQIRDEFRLVLSNRLYNDKFGVFGETFNDVIERCISMEDFIRIAEIEHVGVPLFVAHGEQINPTEIFKRLNSIKEVSLFNLETCYIIVSLPIFNKDKMTSLFTKFIAERVKYYEQAARM